LKRERPDIKDLSKEFAESVGLLGGAADRGALAMRKLRRATSPVNRSGESERRRRQIERGILKCENRGDTFTTKA
jgi:chromosome condensin MukBEF ATPase and DNA-binding subunit MukB